MNTQMRAWPGQATIDEVFVLYHDGRLILHETRRIRPDVDPDILASMLTAVQGFVADSFQSGAPMNEIGFGDRRILMTQGRWLALAMVVEGAADVAAIHAAASDALARMETDHGQSLGGWNGMAGPLAAALHPYIRDLTATVPSAGAKLSEEAEVRSNRRSSKSTKLVAGVLAVSVLILSLAVLNLTGKLGPPIINLPGSGGEPPVTDEPERSGALTVRVSCSDWIDPCVGLQLKLESGNYSAGWSGVLESNASHEEPFVVKWKATAKCLVVNVTLSGVYGGKQPVSVCDGDQKTVSMSIAPPTRVLTLRTVVTCENPTNGAYDCSIRVYLRSEVRNVTFPPGAKSSPNNNPWKDLRSFSVTAVRACFSATVDVVVWSGGTSKSGSASMCDGKQTNLTIAVN